MLAAALRLEAAGPEVVAVVAEVVAVAVSSMLFRIR